MEETKEAIRQEEAMQSTADELSVNDTVYTDPEVNKTPSLGYKEFKALKKAGYNKIASEYDESFILQNKKTGMVVELKGATAYHACQTIGWKPTQVKVLNK